MSFWLRPAMLAADLNWRDAPCGFRGRYVVPININPRRPRESVRYSKPPGKPEETMGNHRKIWKTIGNHRKPGKHEWILSRLCSFAYGLRFQRWNSTVWFAARMLGAYWPGLTMLSAMFPTNCCVFTVMFTIKLKFIDQPSRSAHKLQQMAKMNKSKAAKKTAW